MTWEIKGHILYNPKCEAYIAMHDGLPIIVHNLFSAYLFTNEDEAKKRIPGIALIPHSNDEEVKDLTNPSNWEIREAELTATHK